MSAPTQRKFTIVSVTGKRERPVTSELMSTAAYARRHSHEAIDRAVRLMRESDDDKAVIAAAMLVLRAGGSLGAAEKDAALDAAVEARVMEIFARAQERRLAQFQAAAPSSGQEAQPTGSQHEDPDPAK